MDCHKNNSQIWQQQQQQIEAMRSQDQELYQKFLARKAAVIAEHGEAFWAYINGDPCAVLTKTHILEKLIVVDRHGKTKCITDAVDTGEVKWGYAFKHELERESRKDR